MSLRGVPSVYGEVYICGIGGSQYINEERLLPGGDCDRSDKITEDPSRVAAAMRSFGGMSQSIGGDGKKPLVTQACMRPCAPDALPILGPVDGISNAYMATAGNCWGILWSPVAGEIIADLITKGKSAINIKPFSPTLHAARSLEAAEERCEPRRSANNGRALNKKNCLLLKVTNRAPEVTPSKNCRCVHLGNR